MAEELELREQTLRNGIKAAEAGTRNGAPVNVVTPEQRARSRLRAEHVRLKRDHEILHHGGVRCQGHPVTDAWIDGPRTDDPLDERGTVLEVSERGSRARGRVVRLPRNQSPEAERTVYVPGHCPDRPDVIHLDRRDLGLIR